MTLLGPLPWLTRGPFACTCRRLTQDEQAAILERARSGKLQTNLVLERARANNELRMSKGGKGISSATCEDLNKLVEVDTKALADELKVLEDLKKAASKFCVAASSIKP